MIEVCRFTVRLVRVVSEMTVWVHVLIVNTDPRILFVICGWSIFIGIILGEMARPNEEATGHGGCAKIGAGSHSP